MVIKRHLEQNPVKLKEYVANGGKLGFLIYPPQRNVYGYDQALSSVWTILNPCRVIPNSRLHLDLTEICQ